jgi:hypothetical protein
MKEVWREHPYHKGLLVSSLGRIKLPETKAKRTGDNSPTIKNRNKNDR